MLAGSITIREAADPASLIDCDRNRWGDASIYVRRLILWAAQMRVLGRAPRRLIGERQVFDAAFQDRGDGLIRGAAERECASTRRFKALCAVLFL